MVKFLIVNVSPFLTRANVEKVKVDIAQLEKALELYKFNENTYPSTQQGLLSLVIPSEDLKIDVAEVMTGDCVAQIKTKEAMNTIAFHPKELVLAYAGDGGDISLWSAFTAISAGTK